MLKIYLMYGRKAAPNIGFRKLLQTPSKDLYDKWKHNDFEQSADVNFKIYILFIYQAYIEYLRITDFLPI